MGYHDAQQVCTNGHQITANYHESPEFRRTFCHRCGARTIHQCTVCGADIKGKYHADGVIAVGFPTPVPEFCDKCGSKFPWAGKNTVEGEGRDANRRKAITNIPVPVWVAIIGLAGTIAAAIITKGCNTWPFRQTEPSLTGASTPSPENGSAKPGPSLASSIKPDSRSSPTASITPSVSAKSPEPSNITGTVEKVSGDQQIIPANDYRNFTVRVVDSHGQPVRKAKVAWQTLECGTQVWVGETNEDGISAATNTCTGPNPGSLTQAATLVGGTTGLGFKQLNEVTPIGNRVTFSFRIQ